MDRATGQGRVSMAMIMIMRAVVMGMSVVMVVTVTMRQAKPVCLFVGQFQIADLHCPRTSANRAHHTTSMSLIRISSPASGISRLPPQFGQGSSLSASSTLSPQS